MMHTQKTNNDPRIYVPGYREKRLINTPENRFKVKILEKNENGCMLWNGYLKKNGYGTFGLNGKTILAHRFAYELFYQIKIPEKAYVAHRCDIRNCVNPEHLFLSSAKVNTRDMFLKKRDRWSKKALLTDCQKNDIYEKMKSGMKVSKLSELFNVSKSTIYKLYNVKENMK